MTIKEGQLALCRTDLRSHAIQVEAPANGMRVFLYSDIQNSHHQHVVDFFAALVWL